MAIDAAWMAAGLLLAALEMLAPGVFLLWIGLGAIGTGAAAWLFRLGWPAQLGLFAVLTVALIVGLGRRLRRRTPDRVNAPGAFLVGQTCRALAFQGGEGRVSLGDGTWYARLATSGPPPSPARRSAWSA